MTAVRKITFILDMSEVKTLGILFSTFFCVPLLEITYVSVVLCALMFASGAVIEN